MSETKEISLILLRCLATEDIKSKPHPFFQHHAGYFAPQANMQCRGEVRSESFERQRCLSVHLELELAIDDDLANRGLVCGGFVSVQMGGREGEDGP